MCSNVYLWAEYALSLSICLSPTPLRVLSSSLATSVSEALAKKKGQMSSWRAQVAGDGHF